MGKGKKGVGLTAKILQKLDGLIEIHREMFELGELGGLNDRGLGYIDGLNKARKVVQNIKKVK